MKRLGATPLHGAAYLERACRVAARASGVLEPSIGMRNRPEGQVWTPVHRQKRSILRGRERAVRRPSWTRSQPVSGIIVSGGRRSNACEPDGGRRRTTPATKGWVAQPGCLLNRDSEASDAGTLPWLPSHAREPRPGPRDGFGRGTATRAGCPIGPVGRSCPGRRRGGGQPRVPPATARRPPPRESYETRRKPGGPARHHLDGGSRRAGRLREPIASCASSGRS